MIQRLVVCAFHFVEIFHLVEIRSVIFLYLLYLFIYLNPYLPLVSFAALIQVSMETF